MGHKTKARNENSLLAGIPKEAYGQGGCVLRGKELDGPRGKSGLKWSMETRSQREVGSEQR